MREVENYVSAISIGWSCWFVFAGCSYHLLMSVLTQRMTEIPSA